MSQAGAGPSSPRGVVRNSALSFVSSQPEVQEPRCIQGTSREQGGQQEKLPMPAGLKALCDAYSRLYPDQPNPLQVTTRLKFWLGGHDPLDYISMYWNPGKPEENVPPHWHYVSFGLSDLHGDGRVHPVGPVSGRGLELSLRLSVPGTPPLWPAALLQAMARYLLTTGNKLEAGDHISWHSPLEGASSTSRVRHLLVAKDPQLPTIDTPHGPVAFLQLVGCTTRELKAAQRGSGFEVLKLIAEDPRCGAGPWLVTRPHRRTSARGARPPRSHTLAPLAGVSATLRWEPWSPDLEQQPADASPPDLPPGVEQQIKDTLQRGLTSMSSERTAPIGHMSTDSFKMSSMEEALPEIMEGSWSESPVQYLDGAHIIFNPEAASLLPLAIDGRVCAGSHFTWVRGARGVSVAAEGVGAAVDTHRPYATLGDWLQVLIPEALCRDMSSKVANLAKLADTDSETESECESETPPPSVPLTLTWPEYKLKISVVNDDCL